MSIPRLELVRVAEYEGQTYGSLVMQGRPRFVTLEQAWRDNRPKVSCIPVGNYQCEWYGSERFGQTFCVVNVPNRTGILFHPGNSIVDTSGCILVGSGFNSGIGDIGIINSRLAMEKFLRLLKDVPTFDLTIRDARK